MKTSESTRGFAVPDGWGSDRLSDYMSEAISLCLLRFESERDSFSILVKWSQMFENLHHYVNAHIHEYDPAWPFLVRAYCSFNCSAFLMNCGALADVAPLLRACLENAVYAHRVSKDDAAFQAWCKRRESDAATKEAKKLFKWSSVLAYLREVSGGVASEAASVYDELIFYGAHPVGGDHVLTTKFDANRRTAHSGISDDREVFRFCIGRATRTARVVGAIFALIYPDAISAGALPMESVNLARLPSSDESNADRSL